jgi:hypothetical protein
MKKYATIIIIILIASTFFFLNRGTKTNESILKAKQKIKNEESSSTLTFKKLATPIKFSNRNISDLDDKCKKTLVTLEGQSFYENIEQSGVELSFKCLKHQLEDDTMDDHLKYLKSVCTNTRLKENLTTALKYYWG